MNKSKKIENYQLLLLQAQALFSDETNALANLSNASAMLNAMLPNSVFTGFYLFDGEELILFFPGWCIMCAYYFRKRCLW